MYKFIKDNIEWIFFIGLILLCLFLNSGCGKTVKEIVTDETIEQKTEYKEVTRREPYPIMRQYTNINGQIEFTNQTSSIELMSIYYDNYNKSTGLGQEDCLIMRVPVNNTGNIVTIQVRGKTYKWICHDNLAHSVVFNIKPTPDTEWPDFRYLGITEDVLDKNNSYDFVRLFVNNVLYEMYYISDFELTT